MSKVVRRHVRRQGATDLKGEEGPDIIEMERWEEFESVEGTKDR